MRSGVALESESSRSSNSKASGSSPHTPMSSIRSACWMTSGKVRPIDITSPTLFISLPMRMEAPRNLARSQRGTLHTVVERGLEEGGGAAGDGVGDLREGEAQGDLRGDGGQGVAGGIPGQSARARDSGAARA